MGWIHGSEEGRSGAHGCEHGHINYGACPVEGCYLYKRPLTSAEEAQEAADREYYALRNAAIAALPAELKVKVDEFLSDRLCSGYSSVEFTEAETARLVADKITL